MLMTQIRSGVVAGVVVGLASTMGVAQTTRVELRPFSTAVQNAVQITSVRGDGTRLFGVDRGGRIRAIDGGTGSAILVGTVGGTVLDLTMRRRLQGDGGVLSAAFPDDFDVSGEFYVYYNREPDNANVLARYRVNPGTLTAPLASEEIVLVTPHGAGHNGGWMAFSPVNGYLYLSLGDDGTAANPDPTNKAQTITGLVFSGKVLRLDVSGGDDFPGDANRNYRIPAGNPFVGTENDSEIWSYGLRNPWRCDLDLVNGDLWIADVGQDQWEEVNYQPAGSMGGQNYGWRCMEGPDCTGYGGCTCFASELVEPNFAYSHADGCSISGGAVYRGSVVPELDGLYIYTDYCSERYWTIRQVGGVVVEHTEVTADLTRSFTPPTPFAVCKDGVGELYVPAGNGVIYKLMTRPCAPFGCVGDVDHDSDTDSDDVVGFFAAWDNGDSAGDVDGDCDTDSDDVVVFFAAWDGGC